jgi:Skp family chaperone for outer membrane proteins
MGDRREKFQQDVQKEQAAWRDMQQAFGSQRANMTPEQIRAKERELQDRVTNAQRQFRDRQRILQQASEYAGSQIERATIMVVRQVAESRGINVVFHREQVVLNAPEFDLTETVVQQLNKMLPTVVIPPEGVSLANFPPAQPPAGAQATPALGGASGGPTIAPVNAAPPTATPAPSTAPAPAAPPRR